MIRFFPGGVAAMTVIDYKPDCSELGYGLKVSYDNATEFLANVDVNVLFHQNLFTISFKFKPKNTGGKIGDHVDTTSFDIVYTPGVLNISCFFANKGNKRFLAPARDEDIAALTKSILEVVQSTVVLDVSLNREYMLNHIKCLSQKLLGFAKSLSHETEHEHIMRNLQDIFKGEEVTLNNVSNLLVHTEDASPRPQ